LQALGSATSGFGAALAGAETLARVHHPELLGEVALGRGAAGFLAGDLKAAAAAYHDALQIARKQKDLYVETLGLAGLGAVARRKNATMSLSTGTKQLCNWLNLSTPKVP